MPQTLGNGSRYARFSDPEPSSRYARFSAEPVSTPDTIDLDPTDGVFTQPDTPVEPEPREGDFGKSAKYGRLLGLAGIADLGAGIAQNLGTEPGTKIFRSLAAKAGLGEAPETEPNIVSRGLTAYGERQRRKAEEVGPPESAAGIAGTLVGGGAVEMAPYLATGLAGGAALDVAQSQYRRPEETLAGLVDVASSYLEDEDARERVAEKLPGVTPDMVDWVRANASEAAGTPVGRAVIEVAGGFLPAAAVMGATRGVKRLKGAAVADEIVPEAKVDTPEEAAETPEVRTEVPEVEEPAARPEAEEPTPQTVAEPEVRTPVEGESRYSRFAEAEPEGVADTSVTLYSGLPIDKLPPSVQYGIARGGAGAAGGAIVDREDPGRGAMLGAAGAAAAPLVPKVLTGTRKRFGIGEVPDANGGPRSTTTTGTRKPEPDPTMGTGEEVARFDEGEGRVPNIAKYTLDPTGEQRLKDEVATLGTRRVLTHSDTQAAVDDLVADPDKASKLLAKVNDGTDRGKLLGQEVLAIRQIHNDNLQTAVEITKKLGDTTLSVEESSRLSAALEGLETQNATLLNRVAEESTAAGQRLNALKIAAQQTNDPTFWMLRATKANGGPLDVSTRDKLSRLLAEGNMDEVVIEVDKIGSTTGEKISALWKAGLLTGAPTHILNLMSTGVMTGMEMFKNYPAAAVDSVFSTLFGTRRTKAALGPGQLIAASGRGVQRGAKEAVKAFRQSGRMVKYDYKQTRFNNPLIDGYVNLVFNTLTAGDRFFRGIMMEHSLIEQLMVSAKNQGLKGRAARQHARQLLAENKVPDEIALRAVMDAEIATFTNEGLVASAVAAGKRNVRQKSDVAGLATEFALPFTGTPSNVATRIVEYSPFGGLSTVPKFVKTAMSKTDQPATQRQAVERLGRSIVGSTPLLLGMTAAHYGIMSLGYSPRQSARRQITGERPNSLRVDDQWVGLDRFSPFGNLMLLGGYIYKAMANPDPEVSVAGRLAGPASSMLKTVTEQSFLSGVQQILQIMASDPEQGFERRAGQYVKSLARSSIPNIVQRVARTIDPVVRQTETPMDAFMAGVPGFSRQLPPRLTQFGETQVREPVGGTFFDPVASSKALDVDDSVKAELQRTGANLSIRRRLPDETTEQHQQRIAVEGAILKGAVNRLIASDEYRSVPLIAQEQGYPMGAAILVQRALIEEEIQDVRREVTAMRRRALEGARVARR